MHAFRVTVFAVGLFQTNTHWELLEVSIHHKVASDLVTRQMHAYYVATHHTIQTKNIQNTETFIYNDVDTQYPSEK